MIDEAAVALTLADPRIWPLKLTRLLAAYGSPCWPQRAVCSCSRGPVSVRASPEHSARLLSELRERLGDRWDDPVLVRRAVEEISKGRRFLPGFGTPFRPEDERLVAFRKSLARRGRTDLPHFRALEAVVPIITELTHAQPNIALGVAACFLDLGLAIGEVAPLTTALLHHMFIANALESSAGAPAWLRELPEHAVDYAGPAPRRSSRAVAAEGSPNRASIGTDASTPSSVAPPPR